MKYKITIVAIVFTLISCKISKTKPVKKIKNIKQYTNKDWKEALTPKQFHILREAGTEHPETSELNDFWEEGTYVCVACETPLYQSDTKFNAHCGWPSFDAGIDENITLDVDYKIGYKRTELRCKTCNGHLGHVFDDGPTETGKRHCLNGTALKFVPKIEKKQE